MKGERPCAMAGTGLDKANGGQKKGDPLDRHIFENEDYLAFSE